MAHHGGELLVAHFAVAVEVRLADHLVDLLLAQVLAQGRHHLNSFKFVLIKKVLTSHFSPSFFKSVASVGIGI